MAGSINRVILVGNLTADPELRALPSGTSVCQLRIAVNDRIKDRSSGEWTDYANYFDVSVFGAAGENCARFLAKGRQVAIDGRLRYRQWEKDGQKRSKVEVVAESVQFIGPREGGATGAAADANRAGAGSPDFNKTGLDVPDGDFQGGDDDDIPF
jgi:single-strand DNA-binding protein